MNTSRLAVVVLVGLTMIGCSENTPRNPTEPQARSQNGLSLDKTSEQGHKVIAAVTGHAEYDVTATPGIAEKYEVSAERRADGRITGELELKQTRNGQFFRIHGTLICLGTTNNVARLAALVDRSTLPVVAPGDYLIWSVMDNDVNDHEQRPDYSTEFTKYDQYGRGFAQTHCDVGLNVAPFYPVKGHLEVRDPSTEVPPGHQD